MMKVFSRSNNNSSGKPAAAGGGQRAGAPPAGGAKPKVAGNLAVPGNGAATDQNSAGALAEGGPRGEIQALKQQFQTYDKNGDGMLTVDELSAILLKGDPQMSANEVKTLFNKVDRDENGLISFREFVDYIFEEDRLTIDDCRSAKAQASGRKKWTDIDELRFQRMMGKDGKVSIEQCHWLAHAPQTWHDLKVIRPGEKEALLSSRVPLPSPAAGRMISAGDTDKKEDAAAVALQSKFRSFQARGEVQKKRSWQIYQAVEYQMERNQTAMKDFLSRIIQVLPQEHIAEHHLQEVSGFEKKMKKGWPWNLAVPSDYTGPRIPDKFTDEAILDLLGYFAAQQRDPGLPQLHLRYVYVILVAFLEQAKNLQTVVRVSSVDAGRFTVIGDIHGQLRDLVEIFRMNGPPSVSNPYLFNGDFVDRGEQSLEVVLILLGLAAANPCAVRLNRGNHEDMSLCRSYGFSDELRLKYGGKGNHREVALLSSLFDTLFPLLPLATIIDGDVLVLHGGISDKLSVDALLKLPRHKYKQISDGPPPDVNLKEFTQVETVLWSDPIDKEPDGRPFLGCDYNDNRGAGVMWGSDVTGQWLKKQKLALIIRSHECKQDGYNIMHNGQVMTLFSASNYYEDGSNLGAFLVLHRDKGVFMQQFETATNHFKGAPPVKFSKAAGKLETGAVAQLHHIILSNKIGLVEAFQSIDKSNSGKVKLTDWADIVQKVTKVNVAWVTLHAELVQTADHGKVALWKTCLEERPVANQAPSSVSIRLYSNLCQMDAVFRLLDTDGSGKLSSQELERAAKMLNEARGSGNSVISNDDIKSILESLDVDHDGSVSFNEFLEAMRNHGLT